MWDFTGFDFVFYVRNICCGVLFILVYIWIMDFSGEMNIWFRSEKRFLTCSVEKLKFFHFKLALSPFLGYIIEDE